MGAKIIRLHESEWDFSDDLDEKQPLPSEDWREDAGFTQIVGPEGPEEFSLAA